MITLNYDLVPENTLALINSCSDHEVELQFSKTAEDPHLCVPLAKLHGSVSPLTIVPPTWNKVANEEVKSAWKLAFQLLSEANQVRFVGYSLPPSDTYVRYLLASAALKANHLKAIDVICLDHDKTVESRFKSLINFYRFRFQPAKIEGS